MRLPIQSILIATSMLYTSLSLSLAAPAPLSNPSPSPLPSPGAAAAAAYATSSTSSIAHPPLSKRTQKDAKNACRPQFYTDWLGWGNFKKEGDGCTWKEGGSGKGRKIKGRCEYRGDTMYANDEKERKELLKAGRDGGERDGLLECVAY